MPDLAAADLAPTLQQAFGDLLSSLGPASAGIGAALQAFTSGVMTLMSEPRHPALRNIAYRMLMQGVDSALSTRSERTSLPSSTAEMPAWVRSLLEEAMARAQRRGGTLDLKALAQQVKLPLSLLRLWASQVSAANTPRAVTEPGRVSSVVDVLRTAVNEAIWAGANAVRRKGLKLRADFETSLNPISKQSLFTQQRSQ